MNTTRRALLLGAAGASALLAGCASGRLVSGPFENAGATVTLSREWSDITFLLPSPRPRNVKMLSIDGPLLNRLYIAALRPGDSLLRPADPDTPRPTYQSDMSDSELVEFVIDCIAQEYQNPEAAALRPQNMGAAPGVRFDIATRTAEGLEISGTALVARQGEHLHVLLFLAPTEHYYAALLPDVDAIFASATFAAG
jgi:hypothetical protein